MSGPPNPRQVALRNLLTNFLTQRRDDKLEKLEADDPKRVDLHEQFEPATWLADAARRASQLQIVTHTLKAIHPDAKGSSLYAPPAGLPVHSVVGSHCLGNDFANDVVGNAAALDVYKFLKEKHDGKSLLALMQANDPDLIAALSDDTERAQEWIAAFTSITEARGTPSTHTRGKQLYWLVGTDPTQDQHYHLLAPLYGSVLAHRIYQTIQEDRFGDAAKAARQARREHSDHPTGYSEYPHLAVQQMGGTKPQNISQLNSERKGNNYLLVSLPPTWKAQDRTRQLLKTRKSSVFEIWGEHLAIWTTKEDLAEYLQSDPPSTMTTRDKRDSLTDFIIGELLHLADECLSLPPGWTQNPNCRLSDEEKLWLDPQRAALDTVFRQTWLWMDWPQEICRRYASWLNDRFKAHDLPVGDVEHRQWAREMAQHPIWLRALSDQKHALERLDVASVQEAV